jgi:hypothetical protein
MLRGSGEFGEEKDPSSVTGFEHRIVQPIAQSRAGEPFLWGGGRKPKLSINVEEIFSRAYGQF